MQLILLRLPLTQLLHLNLLMTQLMKHHLKQLTLPLIGRVAAGSPILAQEHVEASYPVDPRLFEPDSMQTRGD